MNSCLSPTGLRRLWSRVQTVGKGILTNPPSPLGARPLGPAWLTLATWSSTQRVATKNRLARVNSGGLQYVDSTDSPSKGIWVLPHQGLWSGPESAPASRGLGEWGSGDTGLGLGSTMADLALEPLDGSEGRRVSWLSSFKG